MANYHYGRKILEEKGWTFLAAVVDGRRGLTTVFKDIPVQSSPVSPNEASNQVPHPEAGNAGRTRTSWNHAAASAGNEKEFTKLLSDWKNDHGEILTDKTYILGTRRWYYTHKKLGVHTSV